MPIDRVPCRSEGCTNTILLATATANYGYCTLCVQRRKRAEHDEFIRRSRRTVNLYEGVTDPVEVIQILHTPHRHDPLVQLLPPPKSTEELYASLDSGEANRLMSLAAQELRRGNRDMAEDIGKSLATLTDFSLEPMLETWLAENRYWPSVIFRNAGPVVRDRLLSVVNRTPGGLEINHALRALAWIGDEQVCEKFLKWENSPPAWRRQLHVGPSRYAHVAGWEPTPKGRRDLFLNTCLAMQPTKSGDDSCQSVALVKESVETCRWCNSPLVLLLELDLAGRDFAFLRFDAPFVAVLTCEACTCFGTIYGKSGPTGVPYWSEKSIHPEWLPEDIRSWERGPWSGVKVELKRRRAIHAVDWCMDLKTSQIGGLPCWVQDAEYPCCPECQKTMTFIAQLDNAQFPGHEGIYYAFLCPDCRMTATSYQQT